MTETWQVRSGADIGRAIAAIRSQCGMSQEELAEAAVIDRSYLSKLEAGRSVSLLEHSLRILRRLGATVSISFDRDHAQT